MKKLIIGATTGSIGSSLAKKTVAEGSDSSSVANFLLSDNSSWITGQILGVDGGRSSLT
jgi:enoyl-[acyl-carrier-protein] reductase (NADH)